METGSGMGLAVAALQKFITDSEIKVQAKLDLNKVWERMVGANDDVLKRNGWIINCSLETVQFYVYNGNDWIRLIPAHRVYVQPNEIVEIHGGIFQRARDNMVVYKDNRGIAYNIKKNTLHFWTGSAMIGQASSIEYFKNKYHDSSRKKHTK